MSKTVDAHEARVHFGQLLDEVDRKDYTFFVKRRGKVVAVILSPDDYLDLVEVTAEESSLEFIKQLKEAKGEFELGEAGTEEDILAAIKEK